jgi:hypothetical protein
VVALRSRRLEALFGKTLDTLTAADLRGLVNAQAQEAFDLDFKAARCGGTDKEKRALAVDVAATVNTAGGVILIGTQAILWGVRHRLTPDHHRFEHWRGGL